MIKKLIIGTFDKKIFDLLNQELTNIDNIKVGFFDTPQLFKNQEIDVINSPTTFMEEFNSKTLDEDCQIIETKNKYNLPDYVVTSPNFIIPSKLTETEMGYKQIEIPLRKVLQYFKNSEIVYGIHTEYSFAYFNVINEKLIENIITLLRDILNEN